MSHPVGYYTNYTPGDGSYLEALQETYGSWFEQMTKREKFVILTVLCSHCGCEEDGNCRAEIFDVARELTRELTAVDQAGVIEALINQIRWGQNAEPIHNS